MQETKHTPTPMEINGEVQWSGQYLMMDSTRAGGRHTIALRRSRTPDIEINRWIDAGENKIVRAVNAHDELVAVMRDVAALLPMAARMHPADLAKLQTRVVEVLAKAGGS